jgi:hypothetical protein
MDICDVFGSPDGVTRVNVDPLIEYIITNGDDALAMAK